MLDAQTVAHLLVVNERELKELTEKQKELKENIRAYPGQKFTTNDGSTVSVSNQTEDRVDGTQIVFNEARYIALDPDSRALLENLGVVTVQPKIVKGSAPRVTVKPK